MASLILFSAQLPFLMMVLQKVQLKKRSLWIEFSSCPPNELATAVRRKQGFDMQRLQLLGCLSLRAVHNSNSASSQKQGAEGRRTAQVLGMQLTQIVALAGVSRAPHFLSFEPPLPSWSDLLTHISSRFHSFHSALISTAISFFRTTRSSDKWRLFVTFNN